MQRFTRILMTITGDDMNVLPASRHKTLWCVFIRTFETEPWMLVCAGCEIVAKEAIEKYTRAGLEMLLVPSRQSGEKSIHYPFKQT